MLMGVPMGHESFFIKETCAKEIKTKGGDKKWIERRNMKGKLC